MAMKIKRDIKIGGWSENYEAASYPQKVAGILNDKLVFNFPEGIPAFETAKKFLIVLNEKIKPFIYLKSLDIEELGFVCVDPFLICPDYSVSLPAKDMSLLELKDPGSALVLAMVTVEGDPKNTTANLLAPIIINMDNLAGRQVILEDNYPVRFRIWEGLENVERNKGGR